MNVQTRHQFDQFMRDLREQTIKVFDTETSGLKLYQGHGLVSLQVYFPAVDRAYTLPFRYGQGEVEVRYTKQITPDTTFENMSWQGRTKKQLFLRYWFDKFRKIQDFENLPAEWLDEVRSAWGAGIHIGHNTRFDAHVLYRAGFPDMEMVYDTMVALHIVLEDWAGSEFVAPFTWTQKDRQNGACTFDDVGTWAVDDNGELLTRKQYGNRRLKWQAARLGFEGATLGERGLVEARKQFEEVLTDFVMDNIHDPMNESILYAGVVRGTADLKTWEKQRDRVRSKIELDDKGNMWMLPSSQVAHYAELDTILTYKLYQWCMSEIRRWNNLDLWEKQSKIHHFVAWEMERNGFKLDVARAEEEIAKLEPMIADIEAIFAPVNPGSPKQLLEYLNSGILSEELFDIFPEWWPEENRLGLKTYPDIYLSEDDLEEGVDPLEGTSKAELDRIEDHALARLVREYRRMKKSKDTYLLKWMGARDEQGRVRFNMNDDGTVAGRFSSSGDAGNGQNIPDRNGYTIKRAIVPYSDEWVLWGADYGQLELRLASWIAEGLLELDPEMTMTNLFLSGEDMHSYTRDMVNVRDILFGNLSGAQIVTKLGYSLQSEKVDNEEKQETVTNDHCRFVAKTMNFGLLYSGGWPMLSKLLKIDPDTAKVLVNKWRRLYPAFPKAQAYFTELGMTPRLNPSLQEQFKTWMNTGEPPEVILENEAAFRLFPDLEMLVQSRSAYLDWADDTKRNADWLHDDKLPMYGTQPITGRHRRLHNYSRQVRVFRNGQWQTFDGQEAGAKKLWNNTVQGLGGFLCGWSGYRINSELGTDKIKMFAQIHDALDGYIRADSLHLITDIGKIMTDWTMITPELTVDLQGSSDGTWQGMDRIDQRSLWIASNGAERARMKDHYGRDYYQWTAVVLVDGGKTYEDMAIGIDPNDAEQDLTERVKRAFPGKGISIELKNRDQWVKYR